MKKKVLGLAVALLAVTALVTHVNGNIMNTIYDSKANKVCKGDFLCLSVLEMPLLKVPIKECMERHVISWSDTTFVSCVMKILKTPKE